MKRGYIILLLSITAGLLCSCQGLFNSDQIGQAIRFSAVAHDFPSTKTYYSGKTVNVGGEEKEIIYWGSTDGVASDDVTVFMYWEQQGASTAVADPNAAHSLDYSVVPTDNVINERHYGQLQSKGGGELTWKGDTEENVRYDHYFYSVYPAGSAGISYAGPDEVELEFNLPAGNANNMRYAYMAAAAQSVPTQESKEYNNKVNLDYYPMITTLSVTLINESDKIGNLDVSISASPNNKKNPLFGSYFVKQTDPGEKFVSYDIQESRPNYKDTTSCMYSFSGKGSQNAIFFIRPRNYEDKDVILTVGDKAYPLPALKPCHKYNITVKLGGEITIDDNGLAQLIFALLLKGDHNTCWATFGEYLKTYFGYEYCDPDFLNGLYRELEKMKNAQLSEMAAKLNELFPGDKLSGLLDELSKLTEIDNVGNGPKLTADSLDLSIFKNAQKINLKLEQNTGSTMSISVSGLKDLTTIEIKDGTSQKFDLIVTDCESLQTITIGQNEELQNLKLIDTPLFKEATINNQNRDVVSIELNNCSTKVNNATIDIKGNRNNDPVISRKGDTANVTIKWGNGKKDPQ